LQHVTFVRWHLNVLELAHLSGLSDLRLAADVLQRQFVRCRRNLSGLDDL
jgi:hypothetical protein